MNSCRKGKANERRACKFLESLGFAGCRRTVQHCGRSGQVGDVVCDALPHVHIEVKSGYTGSLKEIESWCTQAARDCPLDKRWCVIWFPTRQHPRMFTRLNGVMVCIHEPREIYHVLRDINGLAAAYKRAGESTSGPRMAGVDSATPLPALPTVHVRVEPVAGGGEGAG